MNALIIGIIRETKNPPDRRVPLSPAQCRNLERQHEGVKIIVQPSRDRCFSDREYEEARITVRENLEECDVLLGVKEPQTNSLLKGKTYLFFSHTAKKQPSNRKLLQAVVSKQIRLIDYEYLCGPDGERVVAFGRWAGLVGAYNGLRAFGLRTGRFDLPPAYRCNHLEELMRELEGIEPGKARIAVTGGGRVAGGALEVLKKTGIREVSPVEYLSRTYTGPVFTRLDPWHYTVRRDGRAFDFDHFVGNPGKYRNAFLPYARRTDLYIASHFWDPRSPELLTRKDLTGGRVPIRIIADISCDIGGPIASTLRASTIEEPFYGYDPVSGTESDPFVEEAITVMAVDNLPGELPRDASEDFGRSLQERVLPELAGERDSGIISRACIAENGALTSGFAYLAGYLEGRE
jgi:saccharopine dehydrogenase (NAD+, L-lysine-forming)